MEDRQKKARVVIDELHALLHTAEKSNPNGDITYLDVTRIIGRIREHFPDEMPRSIQDAIDKAQEICSLKQINSHNLRNRLIGIVLFVVGALLSMSGFVALKATPASRPGFVVVWDWIKHLFVSQPSSSVDLGGPIMILAGISLVVCSIYFLKKRAQQKEQALIAEAILREALENWGNSTSLTTV